MNEQIYYFAEITISFASINKFKRLNNFNFYYNKDDRQKSVYQNT